MTINIIAIFIKENLSNIDWKFSYKLQESKHYNQGKNVPGTNIIISKTLKKGMS